MPGLIASLAKDRSSWKGSGMDANLVRGHVNAVLYGLIFVRDLDEDAVRRLADSLLNQRHFPDPPGPYAEAVKAVLRDGRVPPQSLAMVDSRSEQEILDFLTRLDRHLDELRPWPRPAFLKLDVARWSEFAEARPVAHVDLDVHRLTGLLNRGFDEVVVDGERRQVAVVELRSGELVALLGAGRPAAGFTLLLRDPGDPGEVLARFCEYTRLSPEHARPFTGGHR
jgi:hypothetical protein